MCSLFQTPLFHLSFGFNLDYFLELSKLICWLFGRIAVPFTERSPSKKDEDRVHVVPPVLEILFALTTLLRR